MSLPPISGPWLPVVACAALVLACGGEGADSSSSNEPPRSLVDAVDGPILSVSPELEAIFNDGDLLFSTSLRTGDGLGPLYTRAACSACHDEAVRGPGLVQKMSVVEADGMTPSSDQSKLEYGHTIHPLLAGGGMTPILPPEGDSSVKITTRIGPPVIGRGYLEAILDSEIERVAAEQADRDDDIHGRINHVTYGSEPNDDDSYHSYVKGDPVIGRFGLKARIATLDDFTADAFQGDMGITSPLRPTEFANPDGLSDDAKPGVDVGFDSVNLRAMYLRLLAIPVRLEKPGAELFDNALCAACHVPSMRTRADYPIPDLANIDSPIYSDLLLHRMGSELADGLPADPALDGEAGSMDWRTTALIGLRFNTTYLHDGRAKSIEEAVLMHRGPGSEANGSVDRFEALSARDRKTLIEFVEAL